ncbi:MAG: hypothetical protein NVS9B4_28370 [Candidatus Acidiferrum sp.]
MSLLETGIKPKIRRVNVRDAKDFLVQQATEQALLEGVSLTELEKRMMYFTESKDATEDPISLNEEFEAQYDTAEYEAKISRLLHHAYSRIKKENAETAQRWDEYIRLLRKGDHYILVMWDENEERPPHDSLKLFASAMLVCAAMLGLIVLAAHYNIHWKTGPTIHRSLPLWMRRLLLTAFIGAYIYSVILPFALKKLRSWKSKDKSL